MPDPLRTRTHEWREPDELATVTKGLSGQEYYAAWKVGDLIPPMASTLGFELDDYGEGRVDITCTPAEFHYSPYGMLHGGLAATLLDSGAGCAVHTMLPAGTGYATLTLNVSYLRPITVETGLVRCVGVVSSMGRRVAVAEAKLTGAGGVALAQATATCLVLPPS